MEFYMTQGRETIIIINFSRFYTLTFLLTSKDLLVSLCSKKATSAFILIEVRVEDHVDTNIIS